ncbi:MAG: hypothetical protein MUC83_15115 [Pirellula sp.]|nr:hypothetical protein [Pirellula sp.]
MGKILSVQPISPENYSIWRADHPLASRGRSAVQWHQVRLDGSLAQSGLRFQETGFDVYTRPRFTLRRGTDPPGETRAIVSLGQGSRATDGVALGDDSGSTVDGDNLAIYRPPKASPAPRTKATPSLLGFRWMSESLARG